MGYIYLEYLIYGIMIIIPIIAQIRITRAYKKYKEIEVKSDLSGQEVARKILDENGLSDVHVVEVQGELTDHYDPSRKVVRLSTDIFHGKTISSVSVAAHECGHAIQDKVGYAPMRIRSALVIPVNIASQAYWYIILAGILFSYSKLILIGVAVFAVVLVFQLVTLPVEFNASKRGKEELNKLKIVNKSEADGASSVLHAAALTYVASVLTSILQIVRLLINYGYRK